MILVTGCTGFVGACLTRRLHAEGHRVRGLVRHPERRPTRDFPPIELVRGSIGDRAALDEAFLGGVDRVINLVGLLTESGQNTFERIHAEGTRNLVEAAAANGVKRFLQMSSLGTRPDAASRYHQTKWRAEESVRQSGLDYTIFRPSVIYGPGDAFVNVFARMARFSPALPLLGDGKALMQPIWVEDVARCFAQALADPETYGKTYELGGPEQLTFAEILTAITGTLGKKRFLLPVPFPILKLEAAVMERILPNPPLTTDQLIMAREDNVCDFGPMMAQFNFTPRRFADGIRDYLH